MGHFGFEYFQSGTLVNFSRPRMGFIAAAYRRVHVINMCTMALEVCCISQVLMWCKWVQLPKPSDPPWREQRAALSLCCQDTEISLDINGRDGIQRLMNTACKLAKIKNNFISRTKNVVQLHSWQAWILFHTYSPVRKQTTGILSYHVPWTSWLDYFLQNMVVF